MKIQNLLEEEIRKTMKYRLTNETKDWDGHILHRIECVEPFSDVKTGDKGGWIEKESNLSQYDDAWVYDDAKVYDNARASDNACIYGNAWVYNNARVYGEAKVYDNVEVVDNAKVYGNAEVCGYAWVCGDAEVKSNDDYKVFWNDWSSGRYFTWTRSNDLWKVGCFHGTGEELIKKAYADSESSGKHYETYVKSIEQFKTMEE